MNRRKFVVGVGSLAAVGATAVGTGAFTSITAGRSINVEVAGDSSAYLALRKAAGPSVDPGENSEAYVDVNNGEVAFDFSDSNGTVDLGDGFNKNAVTEVEDLLEVQNQGTQPVFLSVDAADLDISDGSGNQAYVGLTVVEDEDVPGTLNDNIAFDSTSGEQASGGEVPDPTDSSPSAYELAQGESVNLDLTVDTSDFQDADVSASGTVTFIANQDSGL